MKSIQLQITQSYKDMMIDLCKYCENVMGPPLCKFAVVGMGSLSRNEITPYSDFEHIILLENLINCKNHLEYFRWFSVIFHVVILNLQETIIPSLNISYLNDNTCDLSDWFFDTHTSGISFDGMMPHACKFPLGRTQYTEKKPWTTELIKPVNEMLEYLNSEVSLKNGYHLSHILMDTCLIYGDQAIYDKFKNGVQSYKASKTRDELLDEIRNQIQEDFDKFATRIKLSNLKPTSELNIKQLFYRTSTIFITALGKIFNIETSSCFDIINELAEKNVITKSTKRNLSFAVAIACNIRLAVYLKEKPQRDFIQPTEKTETVFDKILKVVELNDIITYFHVTYCLQREIIELLETKKSHFYSNSGLLNIAICFALRQDDLLRMVISMYLKTQKFSNDADFLNDDDDENIDNIDIENIDNVDVDVDDDDGINSLKCNKDFSADKKADLRYKDSNTLNENAFLSDSKADFFINPVGCSNKNEKKLKTVLAIQV